MRIIAAALLILLCALIGNMQSIKVEERQHMINALLMDIRKLSMQLEFTSDPIAIILDKIAKASEIAQIWSKMLIYVNDGKSCMEAWREVSKDADSLLCCLQTEERSNLDGYFDALGRGDKSAEKKNAEYICKILEDIDARQKQETLNKKKLYRSLGTLIGVGLAILIF